MICFKGMANKNIYTAKDVAFDALFSSLSMLLLLTIYFLPFNKNLMGTLLLMFFSCAYKKRKMTSCLITSLVIICLSFLFMDPLIVLFYVFPSLVFGLVFRKLMTSDKWIFYIIGFILFAALFFFESYLYTTFFMQEDFIQFIIKKGIDLSIFGVDQSSDVGRIGTIIGYCVVGCVMSICEVILFDYFKEYYDERIRHLVERK